MTLLVPGHAFAYEMECLLRMFLPAGERVEVKAHAQAGPDDGETVIAGVETLSGGVRRLIASAYGETDTAEIPAATSDDETEWALARLLYGVLCRRTGITPPWGILTGVRPVRLFRHIAEQQGAQAARRIMDTRYLASPEKLDLVVETARIQEELMEKLDPRGFSLYVSIPFCPSRCLYCSFVSHDIKGAARLVPDYLHLLCEEIRLTGEIAARQGLVLQTVYIGGGTPTTLDEGCLETILDIVDESFDHSHRLEYTVEAGRPDTITPAKLRALRSRGVDRVSINPQTMDDQILRRIGRSHTARQTREAFAMAREAGFGCINMDLIAGLPGEDGAAYAATVGEVLDLAPENVTVHTLTVKRSSRLREEGEGGVETPEALPRWMDREDRRLRDRGYRPYYLYRQKGTVRNLENTGYALPGHEGLYNVLIMEEVQTILAVGAGAVTKLCGQGSPLERVFNFKFPHEYIHRFAEIQSRKAQTETLLQKMHKTTLPSQDIRKGESRCETD